MNPEIRFRVNDDIYSRAEEVAERLGFAGKDAGRSAGVPLLARAAFYDWLGLPWPQDLPQPLRASNREISLAPGEPGALVRLTITHQVREGARWTSALEGDRALPLLCHTTLCCPPHELPVVVKPYVRLDDQGDLGGQLRLLDLMSLEERLTWEELERYLHDRIGARKSKRASGWEETLRQWALQSGSDWLKARLEEGFEWMDLGEQEWAQFQVDACLQGESPLQAVQDQQSLGQAQDFDALLPDRQPSWSRIQLLRTMRARLGDEAIRLSLVQGHKERVEARRRSANRPFLALLWQVELPSGRGHSFMSHIEPVP